jgi:hypothetical protein
MRTSWHRCSICCTRASTSTHACRCPFAQGVEERQSCGNYCCCCCCCRARRSGNRQPLLPSSCAQVYHMNVYAPQLQALHQMTAADNSGDGKLTLSEMVANPYVFYGSSGLRALCDCLQGMASYLVPSQAPAAWYVVAQAHGRLQTCWRSVAKLICCAC